MNIQKASWKADGNSVRLTMPLTKVDEENRIVSGYATLDNVDTGDDCVLASASVNAFENFRGNIRLMHQPVPAGKLVNFQPTEYYDPESQSFYNGIYVDVYVSKGAPDIWEMCLDGTLTGFSIGGQINEAESQYVADAGRVIRFIKDYTLIELSLVDSPANQLCDIVSITKAADGSTEIAGMATEVVAENVFWCGSDKIAFTSQDEAKDCNVCGGTTETIGWFESDGGDKTEKVRAIVADFAKTVEGRETTMADEIEVTDETQTAEVPVEETPAVEAPVETEDDETTEDEVVEAAEELEEAIEEVVEEIDAEIAELAAEVESEDDNVAKAAKKDEKDPDNDGDDDTSAEGDDDEDKKTEKSADLADLFAEFSASIQKALGESAEATAAELVKVNDKIAALDAVANKLDELEKKFNAVSEKVESVEKAFGTVEKSVGLKKSGDLGGSTEDKLEKSSKSVWGGRFFGSVDNI
jgi:hypothetical protein